MFYSPSLSSARTQHSPILYSFLAGASSDWLHSISPRLPFAAASGFALISFTACLIFARVEKSLSRLPRRQPSSLAQPTHKHGTITLASYAQYGDPFWLYIAICCFAGVWYTTIHLSTNLLQAVYDIEQGPASKAASVLLLSPTFVRFLFFQRFSSFLAHGRMLAFVVNSCILSPDGLLTSDLS